MHFVLFKFAGLITLNRAFNKVYTLPKKRDLSTLITERKQLHGRRQFVSEMKSGRVEGSHKCRHDPDFYVLLYEIYQKTAKIQTSLHIRAVWSESSLGAFWIALGPVVQSVVSLTSSLRVISLTVLADSVYNMLIFFAEKMWVAFALQNISVYLRFTRCKF